MNKRKLTIAVTGLNNIDFGLPMNLFETGDVIDNDKQN
jgi:hypothetical protein